jgi:hypothetical protein
MIISIFKNCRSNVPDQTEVSWEELTAGLAYHDVRKKPIDKPLEAYTKEEMDNFKDGPLISICSYKDGATRGEAGVDLYYGITLDYDQGLPIEDAIARFEGFKYCAYTTFRSRPDHPKLRFIFPIQVPIDVKTYSGYKKFLKDFAGDGVDNASFSKSQMFYTPACPAEFKDEALSWCSDGITLNLLDFEPSPEPEYVAPPITPRTIIDFKLPDGYADRVLDALGSCGGCRRNDGMVIALICKSVGASYSEFASICRQISDHDSSLQHEVVQESAWKNQDKDHITNEVRNKWIVERGGHPPRSDKKQQKINDLKAKLMKYKEIL